MLAALCLAHTRFTPASARPGIALAQPPEVARSISKKLCLIPSVANSQLVD